MNKLAVQRQSRPLLPELSELFNGLPAFAGLRPFFDNNAIRLEDENKEGIYEVRAELPGVDPIEDIEVTVRDGQLTIKAMRTRTTESNGLSEFSYGSFTPDGVTARGRRRGRHQRHLRQRHPHRFDPAVDTTPTEKHVEIFEVAPLDEDDETTRTTTSTTRTSRRPRVRRRR